MIVSKNFSIKIQHENFGLILDENFVDMTQFKLFLKMLHGCLELKNNLTFFNGSDFLINIPYKHLEESIITTSVLDYDLKTHMRSKIESLVS